MYLWKSVQTKGKKTFTQRIYGNSVKSWQKMSEYEPLKSLLIAFEKKMPAPDLMVGTFLYY